MIQLTVKTPTGLKMVNECAQRAGTPGRRGDGEPKVPFSATYAPNGTFVPPQSGAEGGLRLASGSRNRSACRTASGSGGSGTGL